MERIYLTFANEEVKQQWYAGRTNPPQEQVTVSALRMSNKAKVSMVNNNNNIHMSINSMINDTLGR